MEVLSGTALERWYSVEYYVEKRGSAVESCWEKDAHPSIIQDLFESHMILHAAEQGKEVEKGAGELLLFFRVKKPNIGNVKNRWTSISYIGQNK